MHPSAIQTNFKHNYNPLNNFLPVTTNEPTDEQNIRGNIYTDTFKPNYPLINRHDFRNDWKRESEEGVYGENEFFRRERILQELVDKKVAEIEELGKLKEEELTQV